ncbi:MAG: DUF3459 domain-containing protein, partial [Actinomycetia bacterium]|nr:DUF3459 domain-containing protein [Actinomycetes bacterium]
QWTGGEHAGFSRVTPWIVGDGDETNGWNAADEADDPASVLTFYRRLIALRRAHRALVYGATTFIAAKRADYFGFMRSLDGERWFIECNLTDRTVRREKVRGTFIRVVSTYDDTTLDGTLRPYEAGVYRLTASPRGTPGA